MMKDPAAAAVCMFIAKSPSAGRGSGVGGAGDLGRNAGCKGWSVKLRGAENEAGIARNEALIRDCR
jgi:hypothetical protein